MKLQQSFWIFTGALLFTAMASMPAAAQQDAPPPPTSPQRDARPMPPPPPRMTDSYRETDSYRLLYTLTESENGKRIGVQHEELVVATGAPPSEVKLGSRIPINVGGTGDTPLTPRFTYVDIGLNISARIATFTNGVQLNTRVEQSSIDDTQKPGSSQQPIIRQSTTQTSVKMVENKPLIIGSLDLPGSEHHLQIEVTMTRIQ